MKPYTTFPKIGVSKILILIFCINTFISKDTLKLNKNNIYNYNISNKCLKTLKTFNSSELFRIFYSSKYPEKNQHIIIISEGSCDTEDRSKGCWKFSFAITEINYILKYIKIENC